MSRRKSRHAKRAASPHVAPRRSGSWSCAVCGYTNFADKLACRKCGAGLQTQQTSKSSSSPAAVVIGKGHGTATDLRIAALESEQASVVHAQKSAGSKVRVAALAAVLHAVEAELHKARTARRNAKPVEARLVLAKRKTGALDTAFEQAASEVKKLEDQLHAAQAKLAATDGSRKAAHAELAQLEREASQETSVEGRLRRAAQVSAAAAKAADAALQRHLTGGTGASPRIQALAGSAATALPSEAGSQTAMVAPPVHPEEKKPETQLQQQQLQQQQQHLLAEKAGRRVRSASPTGRRKVVSKWDAGHPDA